MTSPLFISIICVSILTFTVLIYSNPNDISTVVVDFGFQVSRNIKPSGDSPFLHIDETNDYMDTCALPIYDFNHPTIKKYLKEYNPIKNCDTSFHPWTSLKNGEWKIIEKNATCLSRCFVEDGFKSYKTHDWMGPGPADCEFLESVCKDKEGKEVHGYMHTQIIKKNIQTPITFKDAPNVFVFLIDSVSFGMAKRSLPKTLNFLSQNLSGVEFPFINKVGENSQPNGFPLWFGKQVEKAKRVGGEDIPVDWTYQQFCKTPLDNQTHIFKDFETNGYVTLHAEDWAKQMVDSWPFCKGFQKSPVHHSMRPFQLAYEGSISKVTQWFLEGGKCRMRDQAVLEYFEQFLEAYKDRPKFSWLWLNVPAHSNFNGIAWYDDIFFEFFKRNHKIFSESFTIVMGDHGYRMGSSGLFSTEIGGMEMHNPFLSISIPKRLKNRKILEILQKNAQSLQTHYDTRATLLDIVKYQPLSMFNDRKNIQIPWEKGNSLVREQPEYPRTCGRLPIPQQYCICRSKQFNVNDEKLKKLHGEKLVDHINHHIELANLTDICINYTLQEVSKLKHVGFINSTSATYHTYQISVKVKNSPAHFDTLLMHNEKKNQFEFEKVTRLDTYGTTADCTKDRGFEKLCYCKKQETTSTTEKTTRKTAKITKSVKTTAKTVKTTAKTTSSTTRLKFSTTTPKP